MLYCLLFVVDHGVEEDAEEEEEEVEKGTVANWAGFGCWSNGDCVN